MIIAELSNFKDLPILTANGEKAGNVDMAIINGKTLQIIGFQIINRKAIGLVKKFSSLYYEDIISISSTEIIIEDKESLRANLNELDQTYKNFGPVVGVVAITESGKRLGRVADLYVDTLGGSIIRFYIRHLLKERIIPSDYLVAITPRRIIFKDVVGDPIALDKAVAEAAK